MMWLAFLLGAAASCWPGWRLKLHFLASQTALFQASLAHAHYAAAPLPTWPESPAVEAVAYPGAR